MGVAGHRHAIFRVDHRGQTINASSRARAFRARLPLGTFENGIDGSHATSLVATVATIQEAL
jgi:hypothetical protein